MIERLVRLARAGLNLNAWMVALVLGFAASVATCDGVRINSAKKTAVTEAVVAVNAQAKEKVNAARKERLGAARPGAAERLRKRDACRDC